MFSSANWSNFPFISLLFSGVSVDLRSRCGGRWDVLALKKLEVPGVRGGKSTQGLTVITGAPYGRSRRKTKGSRAVTGDLLDPVGMV